jgi:hypothetical protein
VGGTSVQAGDLTSVAEAVTPRATEIVDELLDMLLHQVEELLGEDVVVGRLRASIESNVSTLLHLMEQPVDLHLVEPPAGALQWAQQLAQRGAPLSALWRAYHLCNSRFFLICLQVLAQHSDTVDELAARTAALSTFSNAYVDHICARVGTSYDVERQRWIRQRDVVRTQRISDLLAGRAGATAEVEAALGYRLPGRHLGLILWDSGSTANDTDLLRLQRLVSSCAMRLGCREQPLVLPRDQSTVWAWLSLPANSATDRAGTVARVLSDAATSVRGALGDPAASVEGFARTHRQAAVAHSVALKAGESAAAVTPYASVAGISFLCQDIDRAREWVVETLGSLAVDDAAHARLRESVSAFLETGGSLTAAAERLGCHKNTIQYRVRRAEDALGRSVRERRIDLELALQACRWLGPAVLTPSPVP